mgnify:CR=1 FL=1|jgi:prepilin peptidase CpaA
MSVLSWDVTRWSAMGLMLLMAVATDLRHRRIPNRVVLSGALAGLALALGPGQLGLTLSLLGGLVAFSIFLTLHVLGWIGAGDVKLAAATGLYFSPSQAVQACLMILLAGGLVALLWQAWMRTGPRGQIPYGVAIALGSGYQAWRVGVF